MCRGPFRGARVCFLQLVPRRQRIHRVPKIILHKMNIGVTQSTKRDIERNVVVPDVVTLGVNVLKVIQRRAVRRYAIKPRHKITTRSVNATTTPNTPTPIIACARTNAMNHPYAAPRDPTSHLEHLEKTHVEAFHYNTQHPRPRLRRPRPRPRTGTTTTTTRSTRTVGFDRNRHGDDRRSTVEARNADAVHVHTPTAATGVPTSRVNSDIRRTWSVLTSLGMYHDARARGARRATATRHRRAHAYAIHIYIYTYIQCATG